MIEGFKLIDYEDYFEEFNTKKIKNLEHFIETDSIILPHSCIEIYYVYSDSCLQRKQFN